MKVVLFKLNQLGDNVAMVSAVQALRQRNPDWTLTVLTTPVAAELYGGPLGPQQVVACDKARFESSYRRPWELARWVFRIRGMRPDACLVPFDQGNAAHLVARLCGARIRVGAANPRIRVRGSLTADAPMPAEGRPATWNWQVAGTLDRLAGAGGAWPDEPPPPDLRHLAAAGAAPAPGPRRVVIHPGASGPLNRWPAERFRAVAEALSGDFAVDWVVHGASGEAPAGAREVRVGSLADLARCLGGADLFLGNNSGPMHVANALGCPGVVVTGPSALGWDPYWHRKRWTVLRHPSLACAPCERIQERLLSCANLASPMACLDFWTPARVEEECRRRLALAPSSQ
jgi:ADP-heptose:LPS heptosyltransferase